MFRIHTIDITLQILFDIIICLDVLIFIFDHETVPFLFVNEIIVWVKRYLWQTNTSPRHTIIQINVYIKRLDYV